MLSISDLIQSTQQGLDVFENYIPGIKGFIGKPIYLHLESEKEPFFSVYQSKKTGEFRFIDFQSCLTCSVFGFVSVVEGITMQKALSRINNLVGSKKSTYSFVDSSGKLIGLSFSCSNIILNVMKQCLKDTILVKPGKYFSQKEAMEILNVDAKWMCNAEATGLLKSYTANDNSGMYKVKDIIELIENSKQDSKC